MSTEPKLTACRECAHYLESRDFLGAWGQLCGASPKYIFQAYSGSRRQDGWRVIHEVNTDGACPKFEAKGA